MLETANSNSYGFGAAELSDVTSDITRTFPLILQMQIPSYQFRNR